jgi:hypothetical protein
MPQTLRETRNPERSCCDLISVKSSKGIVINSLLIAFLASHIFYVFIKLIHATGIDKSQL